MDKAEEIKLWHDLSADLGFEYKEGIQAFVDSPPLIALARIKAG